MQSNSSSIVTFSKHHLEEHGGDPVIDRDVFAILEELADEDDPDLVAEIVELFLDDSAERMAQVADVGADADAIRSAAHALKSSSANIGALRFSRACSDMEAAARGDDLDGLPELVRSALVMYEDVRVAFDRSTGTSA